MWQVRLLVPEARCAGRQPARVDPNILTAYAQFRDVSVDRQITRNIVLSIDYAGPKGITPILYRGHECERPRQYFPEQFRDDRTGLPFSTISMVQINWLAASGFNLYNVAKREVLDTAVTSFEQNWSAIISELLTSRGICTISLNPLKQIKGQVAVSPEKPGTARPVRGQSKHSPRFPGYPARSVSGSVFSQISGALPVDELKAFLLDQSNSFPYACLRRVES